MSIAEQIRQNRSLAHTRLLDLWEYANNALADRVHYKQSFELRFTRINDVYDKFNYYHDKLISALIQSKTFETEKDAEDRVRAEVDDTYYRILEIHRKVNEENRDVKNVQLDIKLPEISLPTFAGDVKTWPSFYDYYKALIHNNPKLTNIQKFHYLISCLSKEPLALIKSVPLVDANYLIAYDTILKRYQNKRLLATSYWDAIYNLRSIEVPSIKGLRHILDSFSENIEALKLLDFPVDSWDFILFNIMLKKLDSTTLSRFERCHISDEIPKYSKLKEFVENECKVLEAIDLDLNKLKRPNVAPKVQSSSFLAKTYNKIREDGCCLCKGSHLIFKCQNFLSQSPSARFSIAKTHNLCLNCLGTNHRLTSCPSKWVCRECAKKHHTLLHFEKKVVEAPKIYDSQMQLSKEPSVGSYSNRVSAKSAVLLSTVLLKVYNSNGSGISIRALLDSGSQGNFITKKCVKLLGLPMRANHIAIQLVGSSSSVANGTVSCKISPLQSIEPIFDLDALVLTKISNKIPALPVPYTGWSHISNLSLADPTFYKPDDIDMLLGAELFPLFLRDGRIEGKLNEPCLLNTCFGWILMGGFDCSSRLSVSSFHVNVDPGIDLKRFWELEEVPQPKTLLSKSEISAENYFTSTVERLTSGRYCVKLPFAENSLPRFVGTRKLALQRFYSLERRLLKSPNLSTMYSAFMEDYLSLSHMSKISAPDTDSGAMYYIPHHGVVNLDSPNSKIRVVFDASAYDSNKVSLNSTLLTGQKLQKDLVAILLRFRIHNVVLVCDIKQMYRQFLLHSDHRNYQRIVWRAHPDLPVEDFVLNTVTYGVVSAPFLALRTIAQLVSDEGENFPNAAKALETDIYVDDVVTGCASVEEALALKQQLIDLCERAQLELRKWSSNIPKIVSDSVDDTVNFNPEDSVVKILGLRWIASEDTFSYRVGIVDRACTKRNILSELAKIYDPLGFLSPVIFGAKLLIRRLWLLKCDWDDRPPGTIVNKWNQFRLELPCLSDICIPRKIYFSNCCVELHAYCDASELGYASVIYFRSISKDGSVDSSVVFAKSKVAPLKTVSIPRLELCAAHLLAKSLSYVIRSYSDSVSIKNIVAWSDSMVALTWIKSSPHRWKTFVANRVSYIQEVVPSDCWRYIESEQNPADCASRGLSPSQLAGNKLWWEGPRSFRTSDHSTCEGDLMSPDSAYVSLEEKKVLFSSNVIVDDSFITPLLDYYSNLTKIQRIVIYCNRFIWNSRNPGERRHGALTETEFDEALLLITWIVQQQSFVDLISKLNNKLLLPKQYRKLNLFIDDHSIVRVGGRLRHSELSYDQKFPALLPGKHRLTMLIVQDIHFRYSHPGVQTSHFLIAQRFWILSAKRTIRTILSNCYKCFRSRPTSLQPPMGDLPACRITQVKAFQRVGIDFGGPFFITLGKSRGVKSQKAYICLFVCLAVKAIHLELVSELSSDAFLAALRRFIARRGKCTDIYSDCGTNFVGAYKEITIMMKTCVNEERIKWHFNPPAAPHFGGIWEAGIKSVKSHLIRVVGEQRLTFEEFYTVLTQIESVLNSRPLFSVSTDPNDISVITPGHFLVLSPLTAPPDSDVSKIPINRLNRWQLLQRLYQDFWKRWSREYLHTLQQRSRWTNVEKPPEINIDTIVLIKNDFQPPLKWSLGRVIEVHRGRDGIIRVATLRTAAGLLKRPVVKLCPLPTQ